MPIALLSVLSLYRFYRKYLSFAHCTMCVFNSVSRIPHCELISAVSLFLAFYSHFAAKQYILQQVYETREYHFNTLHRSWALYYKLRSFTDGKTYTTDWQHNDDM